VKVLDLTHSLYALGTDVLILHKPIFIGVVVTIFTNLLLTHVEAVKFVFSSTILTGAPFVNNLVNFLIAHSTFIINNIRALINTDMTLNQPGVPQIRFN
jgi:hypothetical protein